MYKNRDKFKEEKSELLSKKKLTNLLKLRDKRDPLFAKNPAEFVMKNKELKFIDERIDHQRVELFRLKLIDKLTKRVSIYTNYNKDEVKILLEADIIHSETAKIIKKYNISKDPSSIVLPKSAINELAENIATELA